MIAAVAVFVAINAGRGWRQDGGEILGDEGLKPHQPNSDDLARAREQGPLPLGMPEGRGGWYQATDKQGKLAQQYRFDYLDPTPPDKPPNWALMTRPEAELYSDGRVVTLTSESALVYLPNRALESGTLTGSVVICVYQMSERRSPRIGRDRPALVIRTAQADYDDVLGAVRCPGEFDVETEQGEFHGSGLTLLVKGEGALPDVNVPGDVYGRLAMAGRRGGPARTAPEAAPSPVAAPTDGTEATPAPGAVAPGAAEAARFYLVSLPEDVLIRQGEGELARTLRGDLLEVIFSPRSEALSPGRADAPASPGVGATQAGPAAPAAATDVTAPTVTATDIRLAPPPAPDDVHITSSGGLTMTSLGDSARRPASDADATVEITGAPLELFDTPQQARVTCRKLAWHALAREIELLSSPEHPLTVESPRLAARGDRFWLRPDSRRGGFSGAGSIVGAGVHGAVVASEGFQIAWKRAVELFFGEGGSDAGGDAGGAGALGPLERAEFVDGVEVVRGDVRVWSDSAEAHFAPAPAPAPGGAAGGVELSRFNATGSVQALLSRGGRIFADAISGVAAGGAIEVTGTDVLVVMDRWIIDGGRRISGREAEDSIHWAGPGRARLFEMTQEEPSQGPINRPAPGGTPDLAATWATSMHYSRDPDTIRLQGDVRVMSTPSPIESGTVEADIVTLHLIAAPDGAAEGETQVGRVIAEGALQDGARLEHRSWDGPAKNRQPRLFYLESQRIEYDQRSGEALVPGPGKLLLRDPRPDAGGAGDAGGEGGPWSRGDTAFSWQRKLAMTRVGEGPLYEVDMDDGVEMRHLDLDRAVSTLTCRRITAVLERAGAGAAAPAPDAAGAVPDAAGAVPGAALAAGSAELLSVHAEGTIFLRTPQRDVDADLFDYDLRTGIARIRALQGNVVTIFSAGQPEPVHVREATWNLRTDEFEIIRGRGAGARP